MENIVKENKTKLIIILVIILLTIGFSIYNSVAKKNTNNVSPKNRENYVYSLAETYYEESVYPKLTNSLIDKLSKDTITLNLRDLLGKFEDADTSIFFTKKDECDLISSTIVITPFGYDAKDYTLEVNLVCNSILEK